MTTTKTVYDAAIQQVRVYFAIEGERLKADHDALHRAQKAAAEAFGKARGWKLIGPRYRSGFGLEVLSRGGVTERAGESISLEPFPVFDHPYQWRCDRHAAGTVSFPYKGDERLPGLARQVAEEMRLRLEILDECGWYYPDRTRFFVWTPMPDSGGGSTLARRGIRPC